MLFAIPKIIMDKLNELNKIVTDNPDGIPVDIAATF